MKTLLILRHAEAQADAPAGDHARQLTERGQRDAAAMANHIRTRFGAPDAIVTSDARRAEQTAEIVSRMSELASEPRREPRLYTDDLETILSVVRGLPNDAALVVLVGHEPGLERLAVALSSEAVEVRLPTAGFVSLELDATIWDAAQTGAGRLGAVTTPRSIV